MLIFISGKEDAPEDFLVFIYFQTSKWIDCAMPLAWDKAFFVDGWVRGMCGWIGGGGSRFLLTLNPLSLISAGGLSRNLLVWFY